MLSIFCIYRAVGSDKHSAITLTKGSEAMFLEVLVRFALATKSNAIVEWFVSEKIVSEMFDDFVKAYFRYGLNGHTSRGHFYR